MDIGDSDLQYVWTCPQCGRRVPNRVQTCRCGYLPQTPEHMTEPDPASERQEQTTRRNPASLALLVLGIGVGVLAAWLFGSGRQQREVPSHAPITAGAEPVSLPAVRETEKEQPSQSVAPRPDPPAPSTPVRTADPTGDVPRPRQLEEIVSAAAPAVVVLRTSSGTGTGFYVGPGTILTNNHVVSDAAYATVTVQGRADGQALVVRRLPDIDLAVLRIQPADPNQPSLALGRLSDVRVGEEVLAIGSPALPGQSAVLERTVTRGIVSAVRSIGPVTYVQTDAAINPGNSGGPLIDREGRVIGITTAKVRGAESLALAISIDHARAMLEDRQQPTAAAATIATPLQLPKKSETELMREQGAQRFEATVRTLVPVADEIDRLYKRYGFACQGQQTNAMAYGRDWFGVWSTPVAIDNESTPECRGLLSDLLRRATQVRSAMRDAEEQGRRADVYPGTRRDIRRKYGMDWSGWDQ
jgi:S1-C subfamily serine protease